MQDRYAGDIGDYGKIGLLCAIQGAGLSVGVNWYKTKPTQQERCPDGSFKQDDGKHKIPPKLAECDSKLAETLVGIFEKGEERSIKDIQEADLIPGAVYYAEEISAGKREEWHNNALSALAEANVVFLDPDNGLLVKSVGKGSGQSVKYAFYEEVESYIRRGQSVVVYNHRSRKDPQIYFEEIYSQLRDLDAIRHKTIKVITFPRYSVRDYFMICASDEHCEKMQKALDELLQGIWGKKEMCRLPLIFRYATPEDCGTILHFIRELAIYEDMLDQVVATEELLREWIFEKKKAEVLFACVGGKEVGFALFFHNVSTFLGRAGLYLEDLFVLPEYRGKGYGKAILKRLARIAVERGCGRLEWACLDWNRPSIDFYLSLGAVPMEEWTTYRVTGDTLKNLAQ